MHLLQSLITSIDGSHNEPNPANTTIQKELRSLSSNEHSIISLSSLQTSIASINGLRDEVVQLRNENSMLRNNSAVTERVFYPFPRLPAEMRNMVLDFAIRVPQIHIMKPWERRLSRSKVMDVIQTCTEARNRVSALNMPYYQTAHPHTIRKGPHKDPSKSDPRIYINLDLDTIWIKCIWKTYWLSDFIQYFCGICHQHILHPARARRLPRPNSRNKVWKHGCPYNISVRQLAITIKDWEFPVAGDRNTNPPYLDESIDYLNLLEDFKPRELLMVMDDHKYRSRGDVSFVAPNFPIVCHDLGDDRKD
jgi:hypothetical protein